MFGNTEQYEYSLLASTKTDMSALYRNNCSVDGPAYNVNVP